MVIGICKKCNKEKDLAESGKSLGVCHNCYKKFIWKPKLVECKRCKRMLPHHAKGFCRGCYASLFYIEFAKNYSIKKLHNIDISLWKKVTEKCLICGFDKIVDLHHLDHNHNNNSEQNLIGLCPNHHKMIHDRRYRKDIIQLLKSKGYNPLDKYETDDFYRSNIN
jgi:hypothetical protein